MLIKNYLKCLCFIVYRAFKQRNLYYKTFKLSKNKHRHSIQKIYSQHLFSLFQFVVGFGESKKILKTHNIKSINYYSKLRIRLKNKQFILKNYSLSKQKKNTVDKQVFYKIRRTINYKINEAVVIHLINNQ